MVPNESCLVDLALAPKLVGDRRLEHHAVTPSNTARDEPFLFDDEAQGGLELSAVVGADELPQLLWIGMERWERLARLPRQMTADAGAFGLEEASSSSSETKCIVSPSAWN